MSHFAHSTRPMPMNSSSAANRPPSTGRVEAEVLRRSRQVPVPGQRDEAHDESDAGQCGDHEARGDRRARRASRPSCRGSGTGRGGGRCGRRRPRRRRSCAPRRSSRAALRASASRRRRAACRVGACSSVVSRDLSGTPRCRVAHWDFAPIHRITIMSRPTPPTHSTIASDTGPMRSMPLPPGSLDALIVWM